MRLQTSAAGERLKNSARAVEGVAAALLPLDGHGGRIRRFFWEVLHRDISIKKKNNLSAQPGVVGLRNKVLALARESEG